MIWSWPPSVPPKPSEGAAYAGTLVLGAKANGVATINRGERSDMPGCGIAIAQAGRYVYECGMKVARTLAPTAAMLVYPFAAGALVGNEQGLIWYGDGTSFKSSIIQVQDENFPGVTLVNPQGYDQYVIASIPINTNGPTTVALRLAHGMSSVAGAQYSVSQAWVRITQTNVGL